MFEVVTQEGDTRTLQPNNTTRRRLLLRNPAPRTGLHSIDIAKVQVGVYRTEPKQRNNKTNSYRTERIEPKQRNDGTTKQK